ncbi:hypothetical protein NDU88_004161 [Pleurodeles waltl]|uniref:Uncharacterized protein n=1 Tax=Pleurodeles waltl TaxID=8319 RepID=A0AAV7M672_PLEWA|nr:hypothetical protein NDU88_004161 [Pleurodeles waltl]
MCGPAKTQDDNESLSSAEGQKVAGASFGHWNCTALELRRTRLRVAGITLQGNNSSTSKAAGKKREELVAAARRSTKGAAGAAVEVGTARRTNTQVMEDPGPQIMEQFGDVSGLFENSVLPSPQANGGLNEGQVRGEIPSPAQYSN